MRDRMRVYIASALTHVPRGIFDEYCSFLHKLAGALRSTREAEVKYALINSDPQLADRPSGERATLCYLWDRGMVEDADVLVAEVSFPSIGVGIELQIAEAKGIPTILCYRDFSLNRAHPVTYTNPDKESHDLQIGDGFVTLMALGLPNIFKVIRYESPTDGVEKLVDAVRLLDISS